jgi:hypothetical protein
MSTEPNDKNEQTLEELSQSHTDQTVGDDSIPEYEQLFQPSLDRFINNNRNLSTSLEMKDEWQKSNARSIKDYFRKFNNL